MSIRKIMYSATALVALTLAGGSTVSANHVHRANNHYLISRCAHVPAKRCNHWEVSPKNPQSNEVNIPGEVRRGLTMMRYHIYGQKDNKVKLEDPVASAGIDPTDDNYVNGEYDLTSKPGYRHYGVLITDRAGTHELAKHHVKFRYLRDFNGKDNQCYDLLESYAPHLVGWVNDNGAYSMDLPTANGPYTKRQFKRYKRYYRIASHHTVHRTGRRSVRHHSVRHHATKRHTARRYSISHRVIRHHVTKRHAHSYR